ncbi:GNAT family N-acetyltransferase [Flavivirga jejuensis]|uniref:GNAT family N-acetyltransferase n=1 Tax=Flavivirga jejuensis TaxID=870487 RepID=A0ABT8WK74_9FLAO|nr:GNAT family N-acetyltransferase [Flavivirga jejuensis]MDO5973561.1 GNAT family N-acetyltransferase [Flavivirga jejuensis]
MEYHSDRFEDYSLLIYKKNKLKALLPANIEGDKVYSHQGLTYGGLVLPKDLKFDVVLEIFKELLKHFNKNNIKALYLKQIPPIYNAFPSDEMQYLMFILKAELTKRDTLSVIDLKNKLKISSNRLEGFKRGKKHHLVIKEEGDFELFWDAILIRNLEKKHNAKPVHSLEEITLLKERFPNNIRQFNVYKEHQIVAGTTVFESKYVAHSQYISGNENKNLLGSLDFLHVHLINEVFKNKVYFDFGTSNENNGLQINKGLQFWKEGFGARTITQDFYKIDTSNYVALNKVFI